MSGRLIILPKKSWHVGKRENIEKVLRDERLAEEEAAAARERAREIAQEGIVEKLTKKRSTGEQGRGKPQPEKQSTGRKRRRKVEENGEEELGGTGQGWGGAAQHVNLFSDAEREAGKRLGQNADHQRERREQELQEQRRSGLAPTALGEGSAEMKPRDAQPWYSQVTPSSARSEKAARAVRLGREVTGEEAEAVLKRDSGRKVRADPMGSLFRSAAPAGTDRSAQKDVTTLGMISALGHSRRSFGGMTDEATSGWDAAARSRGDEKRSEEKAKKEKKHKKNSKKGDKRKPSYREGDRRDSLRVPRARSEDCRDTEAEAVRQQALEELRRRRLARERGERNREIRLLAEREMAGHPLPDERSMAYNNQYNRPVARQNSRR